MIHAMIAWYASWVFLGYAALCGIHAMALEVRAFTSTDASHGKALIGLLSAAIAIALRMP